MLKLTARNTPRRADAINAFRKAITQWLHFTIGGSELHARLGDTIFLDVVMTNINNRELRAEMKKNKILDVEQIVSENGLAVDYYKTNSPLNYPPRLWQPLGIM